MYFWNSTTENRLHDLAMVNIHKEVMFCYSIQFHIYENKTKW